MPPYLPFRKRRGEGTPKGSHRFFEPGRPAFPRPPAPPPAPAHGSANSVLPKSTARELRLQAPRPPPHSPFLRDAATRPLWLSLVSLSNYLAGANPCVSSMYFPRGSVRN